MFGSRANTNPRKGVITTKINYSKLRRTWTWVRSDWQRFLKRIQAVSLTSFVIFRSSTLCIVDQGRHFVPGT